MTATTLANKISPGIERGERDMMLSSKNLARTDGYSDHRGVVAVLRLK